MNLKLLRNLVPALMLVLGLTQAHAQGTTSQTQYFVPQPFPRSPTATALEKYGTYQVNEFTGVPDISIPLYTIDAGGFKVPITLSYHASGNKVTDVSSWVGLGWSVSNPQISRRVYGKPDDGSYGYLLGNMKKYNTINDTTISDVTYLQNASDGTYDTKPDIYSYDFPGGSGKFFFDGSAGNGSYPVRFLPYAPIKVTYQTNQHFTIIDQNGNRFLYGDAATDSTTSGSGGARSITTQSAWKIENMISQNRRDTVSFSYQENVINYPSADGETWTVLDQINWAAPGISCPYYATYTTVPTSPGNVNITTEEDPATISFRNGKVVFDEDASVRTDINVGTAGDKAYALKDIKVYTYNYGTKQMELQKTIVFYKSYFTNTDNTTRLRLDSVQILDKAGAEQQHYRFDYNTATPLPGYTSKSQDYWGYYNGISNNYLTPQLTIPYNPCNTCGLSYVTIGSSTANGRLCDSNHMQAFILTGIHYPTGGYSTFAYTANQYYSNDTLKLAGGLRIKSISSYDGINPTPIVKTYVYNTSRANFNFSNDYFTTPQTHQYWETAGDGVFIGGTCVVRSFNSNPHTDLEGLDGAAVVYPSVTEYIGTPGTNVGRTDYTFTDAADTLLEASMAGQQIYASVFYRRGHLQSKKEFMHLANGSYWPVKYQYNWYTAFPASWYPYVALAVFKNNYNEGSGVGNPEFTPGPPYYDDRKMRTFTFAWYNISSDDNYLTATSEITYDTKDSTKTDTSGTYYNYDNIAHQQVTRTYHTDSQGNTTMERTKFPSDYPSGNAIIDSMVNRNMLAEPIEKYDTLQNAATGVNAVVSGQFNTYKQGSIIFTIVPSTINTLSVAQPLTNFTPSTVSSGTLTSDSRYKQMISMDSYDYQNNIIQYTPRNATHTAILWDHTYELPVAQVKNAPNYLGAFYYAYTGFEADSKGNWNYSGAPAYDATAPEGSYSYPLSAGSITSPITDNVHTFVLSYWSNGGPASVSFNGSGVTGTALVAANGWTYYEHILPVAATTAVISGSVNIDELRLYPSNAQMTTYNYDPSGLRSISDTKGSNSYFEYDFFQRLKNIRDWAGNVVKNYGYHMYDQTYGNALQTGTFTRNNCPPNTTPGSLSYTVPANKYYSSTLASANAEAVYDLDLNGQIKADINCGCPITMVSVQVNNTSGQVSFPITFTGQPTYYVPTGTSYISLPENNNYSSCQVGPDGSGTYNFTMGTRPAQNGVHYATFTSVNISPGSSDLTISIAP